MISAVLASYWAIRVPPFLMPDEVAHADYAFALFDAGTIFKPRAAVALNFVSPQTRYLVERSSYRKMRYDILAASTFDVRNREFRKRIDASAPAPTHAIPPDGSSIPYFMADYPPLYYAIVATAMGLAWNVSHHSLLASFYAARLINVAYLIATLVLSYRILCFSALGRRERMLLFVAIAFFPMTQWMSGYIQPDNQSALLVAACLLVGLHLRANGYRAETLVLLSVLECLLAYTKFQYVAVVAIALFVFVRSGVGSRAPWRLTLGIIVVPALAAIAARRTLVHAILGFGPVAFLPHDRTYVARFGASLLENVADVFTGGLAFESFWYRFGARFATAIAAPNARAVFAVFVITITGVALAFACFRQLAVIRRLSALRRRRGSAAMLRFVGSDVHLNVYVMTTAFLLAFSSGADGFLALQGRYWYPILTSTFLLLVLSLASRKRGRSMAMVTTIGTTTLASISLVLTPATLYAMERDFYGVHPVHEAGYGRVTSIFKEGNVALPNSPTLDRSSSLTIHGEALDTSSGSCACNLRYRIDDSAYRISRTGLPTARLATLVQDQYVGHIGFDVTFALANIRPGRHHVSIAFWDASAPHARVFADVPFATR